MANLEFKKIFDTNGTNGKDGVSPTVSVSKSGTVTSIAITDVNGTKTATINDGVNGKDGERGTGILKVTTAPSSYTTAIDNYTPKYRIALSTVKSQSGVSNVLIGDTIQYSYYQYTVDHLDSSYAYISASRLSIRGAAGTTPVKGTDYWTPADQESIVQQVIAALPVYNGEVV